MVALLCVATLPQASAQAVGSAPASYAGRTVASVLDEIRASGIAIAYSSRLVPATLKVETEPLVSDPLSIAHAILAPHKLTLQLDTGVYHAPSIDPTTWASGDETSAWMSLGVS